MTRSHLVRRLLAAGLLAAMTIVVPVTAQNVSDSDLLLREALHKQQVEGDLPGAIKIYQQIVSAPNRNRPIAARALLEMAGCYEKLGQQAESVYQQIVREFGDQPAAVQARAKLAALRPSAPSTATVLRRIEVGNGLENIVASDGQRAVYWDSTRTKLYSGDLSGTQKRLVIETDQFPRASVSRDLSMVLLSFPPTAKGPVRLAVVKTDGTGYRELTLTERRKPLALAGVGPGCSSWSWDNRHIVICNAEGNTGRLLKVSVADGEVMDLLPGQTAANGRAEFSPDGRWVAYDRGFPFGFGVVPTQGGESHVVPSGVFVDWTRDGQYVLVGEPNGNTMALGAVPISGGRLTGERIPLRTVPGEPLQARTLTSGSLLLSPPRGQNRRAIWWGTLNPDERSITWTEVNVVGNAVQGVNPTWSPDSTRFAYNSREGTTSAIRIHDVTTNDDRDVYRGPRVRGCLWPRLRPESLYCSQATEDDMTEIISVSIDSRRLERIGLLNGRLLFEHLRPDDRTIVAFSVQKMAFSVWEIGKESEVSAPTPYYMSPDGRWSFSVVEEPENRGYMRIRSTTGGDNDWRLLTQRKIPPPGPEPMAIKFSQDGNWLIYHDRDADGGDGLYRISTAGGASERLGDYPTSALSSVLSISPDGRKFLVNAPPRPTQPELWALENFLPAGSAGAKAGQSKRNN